MTCTIQDHKRYIMFQNITRFVRVGTCPVLSVRVTYPQLAAPDAQPGTSAAMPASAISEFNDAYRRAAEAFVNWAMTDPAAEATAAFEAMGQGAAHRFSRRELICEVTPSCAEHGDILTVTTTVTWQVRRRPDTRKITTREDLWRWPSLWPIDPPRSEPKKGKKRMKTIEKG